VHGGCHDGSLWQPFIERLEQRGHTAYGPTVAGHGKGVPRNVTHAESTRSIVDFIVARDLTDSILVPERVRRLVFWSAYVLNDGETALEMLPDSVEMLTQMATDSADNTFMRQRIAHLPLLRMADSSQFWTHRASKQCRPLAQ
jgi:hypothetical protein